MAEPGDRGPEAFSEVYPVRNRVSHVRSARDEGHQPRYSGNSELIAQAPDLGESTTSIGSDSDSAHVA